MDKKQILISIPHASIFVPPEVMPNLKITEIDIKNHADLYTEKIFNIPSAHIVKAHISRLILDVNRAPDDIEMESQLAIDGVVVKITPDGKPIYHTPPHTEEVESRIHTFHESYHTDMENIVKKEAIEFIIDGHSMWSVGPKMLKDAHKKRAEICLGNKSYTTCSRVHTLFIQHFFQTRGFSVAINTPYEGKFILGYHCHRKTLPGIQIEFNRALYMDENTLHPYPQKIKEYNALIEELVQELSQFLKKG